MSTPSKTMQELIDEATRAESELAHAPHLRAEHAQKKKELDDSLAKYTTTQDRKSYDEIIAGLDEKSKDEPATPAAGG